MENWNTPDHHIAGRDRATLRFADGTETAIADWELVEGCPDNTGAVYRTLRGWVANCTTDPDTPYKTHCPTPDGETAHLVSAELRGREPLTDLDVTCHLFNPGRPHPNTWDHPGWLFSIRWKDRQLADA